MCSRISLTLRKSLLGLAALAIAIVAFASTGRAADTEPGGDAESARQAVQESDEFAWQLFLFINRQALPGTAGQADPAKATITDYDENKDVVWETWALASREGEPEAEVFLAGGVDPGAWADLPRAGGAPKALDRTFTIPPRFATPHNRRRGAAPAFVENEPESDEVRMNQSTFEFVRSTTLYNRNGIRALYQQVVSTNNRDALQFPAAAKEVKARWGRIEAADKPRFHWREINGQLYGLLAFHIITKDLPMWFWTDFIHVDLEAAEPDPCRDVTTRGPSAPHGTDGVRTETVGSKWEHYRLKGTQTSFVDARGVPIVLGNELIEGGLAEVSSCMTCHALAGGDRQGNLGSFDFITGVPPTTYFGTGSDVRLAQTDFLFSIPFRALEPASPASPANPADAQTASKPKRPGKHSHAEPHEPAAAADHPLPAKAVRPGIVEGFPPEMAARLALRELSIKNAPKHHGMAPDQVFRTLRRWPPGAEITVAFRGGTRALHKKIADAAQEWTQHGNFTFDFGLNSTTGEYRKWSPSDNDYTAAIRIGFLPDGYWSTVGRDCITPSIAPPNTASMNFEDFTVVLPGDWRGVVLHEFGHALGLEHEHQHPEEGCDDEFRWDDDPGYVPTRHPDTDEFINDRQGRRPGLFTWLSGPPNDWDNATIEFNLRQLTTSADHETTAFDVNSIMKYFFEPFMFVNGEQSRCYSANENVVISTGDKEAIARFFPRAPAAVAKLRAQRLQLLQGFGAGRPAFMRGVD